MTIRRYPLAPGLTCRDKPGIDIGYARQLEDLHKMLVWARDPNKVHLSICDEAGVLKVIAFLERKRERLAKICICPKGVRCNDPSKKTTE